MEFQFAFYPFLTFDVIDAKVGPKCHGLVFFINMLPIFFGEIKRWVPVPVVELLRCYISQVICLGIFEWVDPFCCILIPVLGF